MMTYKEEILMYEERKRTKENNDWIPCSDRFPEEEGFYLVTLRDKAGTLLTNVAFYTIPYGWEEYDPKYEIIAWMPHPEPYGKDEALQEPGDATNAKRI